VEYGVFDGASVCQEKAAPVAYGASVSSSALQIPQGVWR